MNYAVGADKEIGNSSEWLLLLNAAWTNPKKRGWGLLGRERNSGWNWVAIKNGCSGISIISTKRPSGDVPLIS